MNSATLLRVIFCFALGLLNSACEVFSEGEQKTPVDAFESSLQKVTTTHCGGCHSGQVPAFAQSDELASYEVILDTGLVNFDSPGNSRLVTRLVIDQHQCWAGTDNCRDAGDVMEDAIRDWQDRLPSRVREESDPKQDFDAFAASAHVWVTTNCGNCHNSGGQAPGFGDSSVATSYQIILSKDLLDLSVPGDSYLVKRLTVDGHNCPGDCDVAAEELVSSINDWLGYSRGELEIPDIIPDPEEPVDQIDPVDLAAFEDSLHDILVEDCGACHFEGAQSPAIGDNNSSTAYLGAVSRVDLTAPNQSRLVIKIRDLKHNCGDDDNCLLIADDIEAGITAWSEIVN